MFVTSCGPRPCLISYIDEVIGHSSFLILCSARFVAPFLCLYFLSLSSKLWDGSVTDTHQTLLFLFLVGVKKIIVGIATISTRVVNEHFALFYFCLGLRQLYSLNIIDIRHYRSWEIFDKDIN